MAKHNGAVGIVNSGTSVFLLGPEEMGIITATLHMKLEIRGWGGKTSIFNTLYRHYFIKC